MTLVRAEVKARILSRLVATKQLRREYRRRGMSRIEGERQAVHDEATVIALSAGKRVIEREYIDSLDRVFRGGRGEEGFEVWAEGVAEALVEQPDATWAERHDGEIRYAIALLALVAVFYAAAFSIDAIVSAIINATGLKP